MSYQSVTKWSGVVYLSALLLSSLAFSDEAIRTIPGMGRLLPASENPVASCRLLFPTAEGVGLCSGTLIDAKHVLTAAHCVEDLPDRSVFSVTCGNPEVERYGSRWIRHPHHSKKKNGTIFECISLFFKKRNDSIKQSGLNHECIY